MSSGRETVPANGGGRLASAWFEWTKRRGLDLEEIGFEELSLHNAGDAAVMYQDRMRTISCDAISAFRFESMNLTT